jgi:hypothetical protein
MTEIETKAETNVCVVTSLHLHPEERTKRGARLNAMTDVKEMELVKDHGIKGNKRYFRPPAKDGKIFKRQLSIIHRDDLSGCEETLGVKLVPGVVRSNIEVDGPLVLSPNTTLLFFRDGKATGASIHIELYRQPCWEMDTLADGLQKLMRGNKQGVLGCVATSGSLCVGDSLGLAGACAPLRRLNVDA